MTRELNILRYGLIFIPAFITLYINKTIDYELFTLHLLLLLLLVVLGIKLPKPLPALTSCLELLFTAWLCYQYGILMIFPAISAQLFYAQLQPRTVPFVFTCIHLVTMNMAFIHSTPLLLALCNICFLSSAVMTSLLHRAGRGRIDTLLLYDELRKQHFELDEARNRLLQFTSQVENAAQAEERVRISRQLHDDIGHRLIRIKMMMEAAIHTLPSSQDTGLKMMNQIRDQVSASMDDMRAALRRINYAPQLEGAYDLDRLLEETGRDTGIKTSYHIEGIPYPVYPSVQIVLYKNAQEAITNALRHGKATYIELKINYSSEEIAMEVSNNGLLPQGEERNRIQSGGGMGLKGMTERTRLIGGSLELRLEPQFAIVTRLPIYKQD